MQINPAHLASPGKSAAVPGGGEHNGADGAQAFGSALHDAMHGSEVRPQDDAAPRQQASRNEHAATPAVPAHVAEQSTDEEEAPADDAQLDGGLQAFVNSLQAPVTATAMPTTTDTALAGTASTAADAAATAAAASIAATTAASATANGVAALAADAAGKGKGKALALGLDDQQDTRSRKPQGAGLLNGDPDHAARAATDGKVDGPNSHASLRAQEVATSKVAPEFRAALNDAQAARPGLQEALAAESGSGNSMAQAIASAASAASAAAAAGTPPATAASTTGPGHAGHIAPHLYSPPWQDAFGQQVVWMAQNEQQIASLTMNPPELGPVRVTLSISDGQASATFVSLQPEVRQAIQDAVPRLKEMLADAGLQLQQASVDSGDPGDAGHQSAARAQGEDDMRRMRGAGSTTDADDATMAADAASLRTARSIAASRLVDLFA